MSKRKSKSLPLTKSGALIQAREILGPQASVRKVDAPVINPFDICGWYGGNLGPAQFEVVATGESWEAALDLAKQSPRAKEWEEFQIKEHNFLAEAVNSLRAKTKEFLANPRLTRLLSRNEIKTVRKGLSRAQ